MAKTWRDWTPPPDARSTPFDASIGATGRRRGWNKFSAKKTTAHDGTVLDSAHEARIYRDLTLRERAGEITELQRQVYIPLVLKGKRICSIRVDFVYRDVATGALVYLEAKSPATRTRAYVISRKLFEVLMDVAVVEV